MEFYGFMLTARALSMGRRQPNILYVQGKKKIYFLVLTEMSAREKEKVLFPRSLTNRSCLFSASQALASTMPKLMQGKQIGTYRQNSSLVSPKSHP